MKYIIDIEEEPLTRKSALYGETAVYRAKGFNSLVFDQNGLDKLKPLGEIVTDAYDRGLREGRDENDVNYANGMNEVWEFMKEICKLTWAERKEIFGAETEEIFDLYAPEHAISMLERWRKESEFEVGDEVINEKLETAYVLIPTYGDRCMFVSSEYEWPQIIQREGWRKTGNRSNVFAKAFKDFVEAYRGEEK